MHANIWCFVRTVKVTGSPPWMEWTRRQSSTVATDANVREFMAVTMVWWDSEDVMSSPREPSPTRLQPHQ